MKHFHVILLLAFFAGVSFGQRPCGVAVSEANILRVDNSDFYLMKPLPIRQPKEAALARLTPAESRRIVAAYRKMEMEVHKYTDGNAINATTVAYYQTLNQIDDSRRVKLVTLVNHLNAFLSQHLEEEENTQLSFAICTGANVLNEGAMWEKLGEVHSQTARRIGSKIAEAKDALLAMEREKLRALDSYALLLRRLGADVDHASWRAVNEQEMMIAETILSWNGLVPERITFSDGKASHEGLTWRNPHVTALGQLLTTMQDFEKGRTYQVVYAPRYIDHGDGAAASITHQQSPRRPDIFAVSSRTIELLRPDFATEHEIRHASGFKLHTDRIDWNLQAYVMICDGKLPEVPGAPTGFYSFHELYTFIVNVQGHANDSLSTFREGEFYEAEFNAAKLSYYSSVALAHAQQIEILIEAAKKTVRLARERWTEQKNLHVDYFEVTNAHEEKRKLHTVGAGEDSYFGFGIATNVQGEEYVEAMVLHDGVATGYDFMDKSLVAVVKEYEVAIQRDGNKVAWNETLASVLQARLNAVADDVSQYRKLYERISEKALPAYEGILDESQRAVSEQRLLELKAMTDRFSEFTFNGVPKIE